MANLSNIYQHYLTCLSELPLDKRIHFASRLYLWNDDPKCYQSLQSLWPEIERSQGTKALIRDIYAGALFPVPSGKHMIAESLRAPYLAKYPTLRHVSFTLYWAHLLDALYGRNLRGAVLSTLPEAELRSLYDALLEDTSAIAMLSTFAVNFLYLYQEYVVEDARTNLAERMREAIFSNVYDISDPKQLQLRAYLISHSIINASGFYAHAVPSEQHDAYLELLTEFEKLVHGSFDDIRFDNKLELLVCAKLLGRQTELEEKILKQAADSLSADGGYLAKQPGDTSGNMAAAEHRSVLCIMATHEPRADLQAA